MFKLSLLLLCIGLSVHYVDADSIVGLADSTNSTELTSDTTNEFSSTDLSTEDITSTPDVKDLCSIPIYSLNGEYNETELQSFDSGIFVQQAFNYIFTGCYNASNEIGNDFDNNTLDSLLDGALYLYSQELAKNPPPNIEEKISKLQDIIKRLKENGTSSVYFSDIKEYLTIQTPIAAIFLYLQFNQKGIRERFQIYLRDEFLGGIEDGVCKQHTLLWFNDLLSVNLENISEKLWALEMLDATSKIPSGLMNANINWVGSYKQCNGVFNNRTSPNIKGRYCNAVIGSPLIIANANDLQISPDFGLNVGLCFANSCGDEEVKSIVSNSLKLIGAFKVATANSAKCDDKDTIEKTSISIVLIVFFSIIIAWVILATIYDIIYQILEFKKEKSMESNVELIYAEKSKISGSNVLEMPKSDSTIPLKKKTSVLHEILIATSLYSNTEKLFRTDNGGKITCLNGIRMFSMIWIIFGHTFNYMTDRTHFFLLSNIRDLQELNEQWYAQLIINGMYGVDTFFLMSAFLLTYQFLRKIEKSGWLTVNEWIYYYVHRYWRLLPPYMIIIMLYIGVMPYYGNGPLWLARDFPIKNAQCSQYWWTFLTFTNNFLPDGKGSECMGYLWYIPNDYQFYAISPIFLVLLYKYPSAGKLLLASCLSGSLAVLAFLSANVYETRGKDIITTLVDMWGDVYIKPYCRASPYICGIFLGYIFFKVKNVKLSYLTVAIGWTLSTGLALSALFGGFTNHKKDGRRMDSYEYGLFFSLTRLTWSMSIGWIIFACHFGYGGIINTILSCKSYLPLNRISYSCYLIHPPIMVYFFFSQRALFHADLLTLIYLPIGFIVMTFVCGFFYTLFFELPFTALEKAYKR